MQKNIFTLGRAELSSQSGDTDQMFYYNYLWRWGSPLTVLGLIAPTEMIKQHVDG